MWWLILWVNLTRPWNTQTFTQNDKSFCEVVDGEDFNFIYLVIYV